MKSARVSSLTGSVPRKMAEAQQRVSALISNRTKVAKLTVTYFNHWAIHWYQLLEKNYLWLVVFRHLQPIFLRTGLSYSDFTSLISRPDTKYQNLERKPLIDTSYHIQHRLELKYFHFAQFLLNAHWAAHWPQKSENW